EDVGFMEPPKDKTLGFYQDGILRGTCQIKNISEGISNRYPKLSGIANMAIDPAYRNNGIGTWLMRVTDLYISNNKFNLSVLYPSLYSQQIDFYSKFGYMPYGKVMIKSYGTNNISKKDLDKYIEQIGKF
ncbi:MAG: GNAT family N-acetyltransferase, partial [Nanoarchaeota archaeon]